MQLEPDIIPATMTSFAELVEKGLVVMLVRPREEPVLYVSSGEVVAVPLYTSAVTAKKVDVDEPQLQVTLSDELPPVAIE